MMAQHKKHSGGDIYMPPGHTGIAEKGTKLINLNPEKEHGEAMDYIAKKKGSV